MRPHPASPKGRRKKRRILNEELFWGIMIAAFAFAVAFANCFMDWFVGVAIDIKCEAKFCTATGADVTSSFTFVWLEVVHSG